ncbi:hypothetical protein IC216_14240 [Clostridioides sp. ES-S-0145-01]|uniref:DUF6530 family protein n=1 Tax=Clostridioides sp. ES-S-0145-01 TaxID=2770784 RepID=UPI001D12C2E7|nr:hypothetical protein [Clostridioides sp. ES-S-0145-01]
MRVPEHLSHKPIVGVDNYDRIDGKYANKSDAKALSIGKSQWNNEEISAKVWRHTGEKWTRQSEELPLHRVLDLATLILSMYVEDDSYNRSKTTLNEVVINQSEIDLLNEFKNNNKKYLNPRIKELKSLLEKINLE